MLYQVCWHEFPSQMLETLATCDMRLDLLSGEIGAAAAVKIRRAHDMGEVAETQRALGVEPVMAQATARRWAAISAVSFSCAIS